MDAKFHFFCFSCQLGPCLNTAYKSFYQYQATAVSLRHFLSPSANIWASPLNYSLLNPPPSPKTPSSLLHFSPTMTECSRYHQHNPQRFCKLVNKPFGPSLTVLTVITASFFHVSTFSSYKFHNYPETV